MRGEIQQQLGVLAIDIYGLTEIIGPGVAMECERQEGLHINEDHFYPEIIDPSTGKVLPGRAEGRAGDHHPDEGRHTPAALPHPGHHLSWTAHRAPAGGPRRGCTGCWAARTTCSSSAG